MSNNMGSDASRRKWFESMLPHIPYCGAEDDTWIAGKTLEAVAGVSEHRRSAGINWGRQNYCPTQDWALVSGRRGYRFVPTARQAAPFVLPRYKAQGTLLRVSYWGAQKPLINRAVAEGRMSPTEAKTIEKSVCRTLEDLADLSAIF